MKGVDYLGKPLPRFAEPVRAPTSFTPARKPHSARRTMSIDVTWPAGFDSPGRFVGYARDVVTILDREDPHLLRVGKVLALADRGNVISVESDPPLSALRDLAGIRPWKLRNALDNLIPEEKLRGTPLYLLLDDLVGSTLVAPWAEFAWNKRWPGMSHEDVAVQRSKMTGVCIGFAVGSSAFAAAEPSEMEQERLRVEPVTRKEDPSGWHVLPEDPGPTYRRARRIDVWRNEDRIEIDSAFQDSALLRDGTRAAVHEYGLSASADAMSMRLLSVHARPGILPFAECRAAPVNLACLHGTPLAQLRETVLSKLAKTAGCTHLNDVVRALSEVPVLAGDLP